MCVLPCLTMEFRFSPSLPLPTIPEPIATWICTYLPLRRTKVIGTLSVQNGLGVGLPRLHAPTSYTFPLKDQSPPRSSVRPSGKALGANFRGLGLCQSHRALFHGGGLELQGWPPCSLPPPTSSPAGYQRENRKAGSTINKT